MLPNKLTNFFDKPAWINRTLFYVTILLSIALAFLIIFGIFNLIFPNFTFPNNAIDYDNERYLLSALVQSLAATIALVITLSLVAVQLAAQSYSARVIDVYKRNPDMWILLFIYIITIFYVLGLTKIIGLGILGNYMEGAIFVAYFMGFFAFVCLVPYMLKTLNLLKPSTVIKLLAEDITKEKIIQALEEDEEIVEKDPIQPIVDIVNGALERNDYETVRNGLLVIKIITTHIFEKSVFENEEESKISEHILKQVENLGIHAAKKGNQDSTLSAIKNLSSIGSKAINLKLKSGSLIAIKTLGKVGVYAVENKLEIASEVVGHEIGKVGTEALEQKLEVAAKVAVNKLRKIGLKATNHKMEKTAHSSIDAIEVIGSKALDLNYQEVLDLTVDALGKIGSEAFDEKIEIIPRLIIDQLGSLGVKAADYENGIRVQIIIQNIRVLSTKALNDKEMNYEIIVIILINALRDIAIKTIEKKLDVSTKVVASVIAEIGVESGRKPQKVALARAIETLEEIGINTAEQKLETAPEEVYSIIRNVLLIILKECPDEIDKDFIGTNAVSTMHKIFNLLSMQSSPIQNHQTESIERFKSEMQLIISIAQVKKLKQTYSVATELLENVSNNEEN